MTKHSILFLAADPNRCLALDLEARAIQIELARSGHRDRFEFVTRWAAEPLDVLRELRVLKPTIVHLSAQDGFQHDADPPEREGGIFFQDSDGHARLVPATALEEAFGAAGASVKLVVLSACYNEAQAQALLSHVDIVVGTSGAIHREAARLFAIGFYGGLGEWESIPAAYRQGRAAISLEGLRGGDPPQLRIRHGIDPDRLIFAEHVVTADETALPRPTEAEILVVIAQFDSGTSQRIHVEDRIQRAFSQLRELLPRLPVRIERLRDTVVRDGDEAEALRLLRKHDACLMIWGWYDSIGFCPRLTAEPSATLETMVPKFEEVFRDDADTAFRRYLFDGLANELRTWALAVIGELLYWNSRYDDALDALDLAIQHWRASPLPRSPLLDTRIAGALFYRGVIAGTRKGDVVAAAACFREVLELRPATRTAAYNLGDALYHLENYQDAITAFSAAMQVEGLRHSSLIGRGHAYHHLKCYREAIDDYTAALDVSQSADVFLARSLAYQSLGESRLAMVDYLSAKKMDPLREMLSDHLDRDLLDTSGKQIHVAERVTPYLDTARRFLGAAPRPLGTRGTSIDSTAKIIASMLTHLRSRTRFFMEAIASARESALDQAGARFLHGFGMGFFEASEALEAAVTMVRLDPRIAESLAKLFRIAEVRSRVPVRMLSALDMLTGQTAEYAHAMAIVGCSVILSDGEDGKHLRLCEVVRDQLQALTRLPAVEQRGRRRPRHRGSAQGRIAAGPGADVYLADAKGRDRALQAVVGTLVHGAQQWWWKNVHAFAHALCLTRAYPPMFDLVLTLVHLLASNGVMPREVEQVALDISLERYLFLIDVLRLESEHTLFGEIDAEGVARIRETASTIATLAVRGAENATPDEGQIAASTVVAALTRPESYDPRPDETMAACEVLQRIEATAELLRTLAASDAVRKRLRLPNPE